MGTSLVKENAFLTNSSVWLLHRFIYQVAPARAKVTGTGEAERAWLKVP
jgi:hypothetical protein